MSALHLLVALAAVAGSGVMGAADPVMFPFVTPTRLPSASVVWAPWIEAPAGRHGFVQARDGRFYAGGSRIRFFGVNLANEANLPDRADAVDAAGKLSRLGETGWLPCGWLESRSW